MSFSEGYSSLSQWFLRERQTLLHTKRGRQPEMSTPGRFLGTWPSTASLSTQHFAAESFHNNFNTTRRLIRTDTSICSTSMQSLNFCIKVTETQPYLGTKHTEVFREIYTAHEINSAWRGPTATSGSSLHPSRQHLWVVGLSISLPTT
jgi:hypothetical protein